MQTASVSALRPRLLFSSPLAFKVERLTVMMETLKQKVRAIKQSNLQTRSLYLFESRGLVVVRFICFLYVSVTLYISHGKQTKGSICGADEHSFHQVQFHEIL